MSVPGNDVTVSGGGPSGPQGEVPAPGACPPPAAASVPPARPSLLGLVLAGGGGGITVGAAWVVLAPVAVERVGGVEAAAAQDVTFGLLGVLAGLVTSVALFVWPGARPALHASLVLTTATAASLLAWGVGRLLGAEPLQAVALVVVWPLVASAVTLARSLLGVLFAPESPPPDQP